MRLRRVATGTVTLAALGMLSWLPIVPGTIQGTVRYEGKIPKLKRQDMRSDPGCLAKYTAPPPSEMLVLGEGNTVGNVFARVKSGLPEGDRPVPEGSVVLDQIGCRFEPRVSGIVLGQTFKILNSDSLMHNVHSLSTVNMPFNFAMPASLKEIEVEFTSEEWMIPVKCDLHPWMKGYVAVLDHPYYDTTKPDGKFEIPDLPAGTYEIEVWHEALGTQTAEVTLGADETKTVDFVLTPPSKKKRR
jgi:hypothetical protein